MNDNDPTHEVEKAAHEAITQAQEKAQGRFKAWKNGETTQVMEVIDPMADYLWEILRYQGTKTSFQAGENVLAGISKAPEGTTTHDILNKVMGTFEEMVRELVHIQGEWVGITMATGQAVSPNDDAMAHLVNVMSSEHEAALFKELIQLKLRAIAAIAMKTGEFPTYIEEDVDMPKPEGAE